MIKHLEDLFSVVEKHNALNSSPLGWLDLENSNLFHSFLLKDNGCFLVFLKALLKSLACPGKDYKLS